MTNQPKHDSFNLSPSLHAKLRQLADDLTPEEWVQLRAVPPENGAGEPLPSLRSKLRRSIDGLTAEERAQLRLLLAGVGLGDAVGAGVDTAGHMVDLYGIDPSGKKGRPRPDEQSNSSNSGALDSVPVVGLLVPTAQSLPTWGRLLGQMFGG